MRMRSKWKPLFLFLAAAFLVGGLWGFVTHLPGRTVVYGAQQESGSDPIGSISDFFSGFFHKNPVSVVIFGVAGSGHNGADLTDTIVLAYFDPDKNRASLISIPRDLWVSDGATHFKINEALERNRLATVFDRIGDMTGLTPQGYAAIDLNTVRQAIDDLGGVDIALTQPATDWVSGYTMAAGPHHLTGDDAVWLMRNRYAPNGDFFREQNQQNIIKEAVAKFRGLPLEQQIAFVEKYISQSGLMDHVNINPSQLVPYVLGGGINGVAMQSITFDFSTKLLKTDAIPLAASSSSLANAEFLPSMVSSTAVVLTTVASEVPRFISVLVPTAGIDNYTALRAYVQARLAE